MRDMDILRKIKKALAIANDDQSSDGEIQAAMSAVQKMMDKYHLSEEDLANDEADDFKKVDQSDFTQFRSWIGGKLYRWESDLAAFVSKFVGSPCCIDNEKKLARDENGLLKRDSWYNEPFHGKSVVFYGVAEDALIARDLYDELRRIISTTAYLRFGNVYVKEGGAYAEGFVTGLRSQMNEQKRVARLEAKPGTTGLILIERRDALTKYKEERAKDWLKIKVGINLVKGSGSYGASGSESAFGQGIRDGKNADVGSARMKKITG